MYNMFRLKYKNPSLGEIRATNKSYHINYINSLFVSEYIVVISTSQSS